MSLDRRQLADLVVVPVLRELGAVGVSGIEQATELLLNTAEAESKLTYLRQWGNGPALGLWQMEPPTHDDIWSNFLDYRPELAKRVRSLAVDGLPDARQLVGNLYYAAAMARVHYLRVPEPLPAAGDLAAQAGYWKAHYNTHLGKGTHEHFLAHAQAGAGGNVA